MDYWIGLLVWIFVALPLHEFGHYLVARKFQWHPIRLKLCTWHHVPYAFAVVAANHLNVKSDLDFFKAYKQVTTFYAMGGLFSMIGISFGYTLGVFSTDVSFFLMTVMALYMLAEIIGLKHEPSIRNAEV